MWNESGGLKECAYCGVHSSILLLTVGYEGGVCDGVCILVTRLDATRHGVAGNADCYVDEDILRASRRSATEEKSCS